MLVSSYPVRKRWTTVTKSIYTFNILNMALNNVLFGQSSYEWLPKYGIIWACLLFLVYLGLAWWPICLTLGKTYASLLVIGTNAFIILLVTFETCPLVCPFNDRHYWRGLPGTVTLTWKPVWKGWPLVKKIFLEYLRNQ